MEWLVEGWWREVDAGGRGEHTMFTASNICGLKIGYN